MNHPEFWGWSTGPLTIHFWGWENAFILNKLACAPRLVHDVRLPWVALEARRSCIVASVINAQKSVCGSSPGVTVADGAHVPGVCCEEFAQSVSCCRYTPKVQNNARFEKIVKWKAHVPLPVSARPAAVCDADQRPIPGISI